MQEIYNKKKRDTSGPATWDKTILWLWDHLKSYAMTSSTAAYPGNHREASLLIPLPTGMFARSGTGKRG
jgi:hypothetical protein